MIPFLSALPYAKWGLRLALCALLFVGGMLFESHRQNEALADRAAREQAAATGALIKANAENVKKINAAVAQAKAADAGAHTTFQQGIDAANLARIVAENKLKLLKDQNNGLIAVNSMLSDAMQNQPPPSPGCVMSPDIRRVLDQASGAADPGYPAGADNPQAYPAPGADGAPNPSAVLTCDQLADGYVALGAHGRYLAAQLAALQAWVSVITRP